MNNQDRQKLRSIIDQLSYLKEKAYLRSKTLINNGQEVPCEHRSRSEGYYSAYAFTIMLLEGFLDGK